MGKPTICIGENKGADQLRSNCEADQRLCFRYSDSTIPLLLKSESSSFKLFSVLVQPGFCRTCLETTSLVFPRDGSSVFSPNFFEWEFLSDCAFPDHCLLAPFYIKNKYTKSIPLIVSEKKIFEYSFDHLPFICLKQPIKISDCDDSTVI